MENFGSSASRSRINARLIEQIPIDDLRPYPQQARKHSKQQIAKLSRSIARFGIVAPILIDDANVIIAGHAVVDAAKVAGLREVPVLRVGCLSEAEKRALRLALNRLAEDSEWDRARLVTELRFLVDAEFDLDLTGFEIGEVDFRLEEDGVPQESEPGSENEVPPNLGGGPAVTRLGDVWVLSRHRLLCGDARDEASYLTLLAGESAVMAVADPPPLSLQIADIGGDSATGHAEIILPSNEVEPNRHIAFLTRCFGLMAANSVGGAVHFISTNRKHLAGTATAADACYGKHLAVAGGDKMGASSQPQHDLVLVEMVGSSPSGINAERVHSARQPGASNRNAPRALGAGQKDPASGPNIKQVGSVADAILDVTEPNDIVLDPFAGSGITAVAAEKSNRRARLMEIDPHICDVVVRRWQAYVGAAAVHADLGLRFDEMAGHRPEIIQANAGPEDRVPNQSEGSLTIRA
jgi:hypothetical protein